MSKILNEVGLEYFWGKVKAFVNAGLDKKVTAVSGKGLSSNDLTDALKSNYDAAYNHAGAALPQIPGGNWAGTLLILRE